jgi:hypothetical protein
MVVGVVGMHPYDHNVTWEKKDKLARRMGIKEHDYLVLHHRYARRVEERRGKEPDKHVQAKYQPLQLRWYSPGGRIQWIVPNCDVGGFPNLRWDHFGLPDTLIAPLSSRAYADSAWTINDDLLYMTERKNGLPPTHEVAEKGHLLVYWTYFMGRQSVRLARNIERWHKRHGEGIRVRYVNADSLLIGVDRPEVE